MSFISFKVEKFKLEHYMQKPKKPWSAKDAAAFFIKFFFITYGMSVGITFFVLSNTTFPKACSIAERIITEAYTGDPLSASFVEVSAV